MPQNVCGLNEIIQKTHEPRFFQNNIKALMCRVRTPRFVICNDITLKDKGGIKNRRHVKGQV